MEGFDLSQEEVAQAVGKDRSTVANALRLLRLPEEVRDDVVGGRLTMGHARALLPWRRKRIILEARQQVAGEEAFGPRDRGPGQEDQDIVGGMARTKPKETAPDPQLVHLAGELKRALGTQVKIVPKRQGRPN